MDKQFPTKLITALMDIGTKNGLAPPKSQDPIDALIHEYYVAEQGRSLFEKRKKKALETLKAHDTQDVIKKTVASTAKFEAGQTALLYDGEHYQFNLSTKAPASSLDKAALSNELVKAGVPLLVIERAIAAATTKNKPAESYSVIIV